MVGHGCNGGRHAEAVSIRWMIRALAHKLMCVVKMLVAGLIPLDSDYWLIIVVNNSCYHF